MTLTSRSIEASLASVEKLRIHYKTNVDRQSNVIAKHRQEEVEILGAITLCELCLAKQTDIKQYIEEQLTALLQAVFERPYKFYFNCVYRADGVSLKGLEPIVELGKTIAAPEEYGDGVQTIVSFALRLIFLIFSQLKEKVVVLDEPFVNLSQALWPNLIAFITDLQEFLDVQILLITHVNSEFPTTYHITKNGDTSETHKL